MSSNMTESFWCIVCVSTAIKELDIDMARNILTDLRKWRSEQGVTSLSIYANKNVLSLIEGPKEKVIQEYRAIAKHPGHHSIIKLFDAPTTNIFFQDYPLLLRSLSRDLKPLDDFNDPDMAEYFGEFLNIKQAVSFLVRDFIKNNS